MTTKHKRKTHLEGLGDFTTDVRVITISLIAISIGFIASLVAWTLLKLIAFFTNVRGLILARGT